MTPEEPKTSGTRLLLEKSQLAIAIATLLGLVLYVGRRMESDEAQSQLLQSIATDIAVMKERNADANAQIKIIGERVAMLEKRLERMEQAR